MLRLIPHRPVSRVLALAAPIAAAGLAPAAGPAAAYKVGVASLHFAAATDLCVADQALPCTPGAGDGEANVLRVLQTEVDGHHQFTTLDSTSPIGGRIWVAAEIGADCRLAHHLAMATIDDDLASGNSDGIWGGGWPNAGGNGIDANAFPLAVSVPHANSMPTKTVAVHVPMSVAFDPANPLVDYFPTVADVLAAGEAEIQRRVDDGMSFAEARDLPYELNTAISLSAEVVCAYNGGFSAEYFMRRTTSIPLRIEYVPVDVPTPLGELPPAVDDVVARAEVTDASLVVLPDPVDPCTLHLSATISTNRPTTVSYRFVNPYGQPSNTYEVQVDHTLVAMISRTVDVPYADRPDPTGGLAPTPGAPEIGGYATEEGSGYRGTYELEVLSPNSVVAADGFSVGYCEVGDPAFEPPVGDVTAEPDATHDDPTPPPTTTLPPAVVSVTTTPAPTPPAPTPPTVAPTAPPVAVVGLVPLPPATSVG